MLWDFLIAPALRYASRISEYPHGNVDLMVRALDALDARVPAVLAAIDTRLRDNKGLTDEPDHGRCWHWSSRYLPCPLPKNSFLHLAAQFNLLLYIKAKAHTSRQVLFRAATKNNAGMLESAIFGYRFRQTDLVSQRYWSHLARVRVIRQKDGSVDKCEVFSRIYRGEHDEKKIVLKRRLETVKYLLDTGVDQLDMLELSSENEYDGKFEWNLRPLRPYLVALCEGPSERVESYDQVAWYFSAVSKMLGNNYIKIGARLAAMRLKALSPVRTRRALPDEEGLP